MPPTRSGLSGKILYPGRVYDTAMINLSNTYNYDLKYAYIAELWQPGERVQVGEGLFKVNY
jgi:hypothetical protein